MRSPYISKHKSKPCQLIRILAHNLVAVTTGAVAALLLGLTTLALGTSALGALAGGAFA